MAAATYIFRGGADAMTVSTITRVRRDGVGYGPSQRMR